MPRHDPRRPPPARRLRWSRQRSRRRFRGRPRYRPRRGRLPGRTPRRAFRFLGLTPRETGKRRETRGRHHARNHCSAYPQSAHLMPRRSSFAESNRSLPSTLAAGARPGHCRAHLGLRAHTLAHPGTHPKSSRHASSRLGGWDREAFSAGAPPPLRCLSPVSRSTRPKSPSAQRLDEVIRALGKPDSELFRRCSRASTKKTSPPSCDKRAARCLSYSSWHPRRFSTHTAIGKDVRPSSVPNCAGSRFRSWR